VGSGITPEHDEGRERWGQLVRVILAVFVVTAIAMLGIAAYVAITDDGEQPATSTPDVEKETR
jgi:hypothetical protein